MNQIEANLLELTGKAVDYRGLSRLQKMLYNVSWHGFIVGTLFAIALAITAKVVDTLVSTSLHAGAIFIIGIFIACAYLDKFASLLVTLESVAGYYFIAYRGLAIAHHSLEITAFFFFSTLVLSVYLFARMRANMKQTSVKNAIEAAFMSFSRMEMQHGGCPEIALDVVD